jgi:hypothetical protein
LPIDGSGGNSHRESQSICFSRTGEQPSDGLGNALSRCNCGPRKEDQELIATQPSNLARRRYGILEKHRETLEDEIACVLAKGIVVLLETVNVDQEQRLLLTCGRIFDTPYCDEECVARQRLR